MAMKEVGLIARLVTTKLSRDVKVYKQAMRDAEQATKRTAEEMKKAGLKMSDAQRESAKAAKDATGAKIASLRNLISNIGATVLVVTALAAAIGTLAGVVIGMAKKFNEAAQEVRLFNLLMGGTVERASIYIQTAKGAGVSTRTLQVGIGQLNKRLTDYQLRLASGVAHTTEFERAITALGIDLKDADGNLRSVSDLLPEIADRISALGPGMVTSGIAFNLMGRGARDMLPWLLQGSEEFKRMAARAEELGAVLTYKDVVAAEDFRKANVELDMALQGVANTISRAVVPSMGDFKTAAADAINAARQFTIMLAAASVQGAVFAITMGDAEKAQEAGAHAFRLLAGILTEEEKAIEAAKVAEEERLQIIILANTEIQNIRERAIQLDRRYAERRLDLERSLTERWEDILLQRARRLEDVERRRTQRFEDLALGHQRRLDDILDAYNRQVADRQLQADKRRRDLEDDAQERLEKLLRRHLERMADIRQEFQDTASEAARRRDAIAFLRAVRDRDRALRDERRDYGRRLRDLKEEIAKRKQELEESIREQREADERRLADQIARANRAYQRQLEDLQRALRREAEERAIANRRQEEDLEISRQRRLAAIQRWYLKEKHEIETQLRAQLQILRENEADTVAAVRDFYEDLIQLRRDYYATLAEIDRQAAAAAAFMPLPRPRPYSRRRAEGGVDVVSRPTTFLAGEAGPEIAAFVPLRGGVHHTFGRLDGHIGGVSRSSEAMIVGLIQQVILEYARGL